MYSVEDMRDSGDDRFENPTPKFTHRFNVTFSFDTDEDCQDFSDAYLTILLENAIREGRFAGFNWESTVQNRK